MKIGWGQQYLWQSLYLGICQEETVYSSREEEEPKSIVGTLWPGMVKINFSHDKGC